MVCNAGTANMKDVVEWRLYFHASENPVSGAVVYSGRLGPLDVGTCTNLEYAPKLPGNYAYAVRQEPGAEGQKTVWSSACEIDKCSLSLAPEPLITPLLAPGETLPPQPQDYQVRFICGYLGDETLLWEVSNGADRAVDYTWRVAGSSESGSGRVSASGIDYFTTSLDAVNVHLFIDGKLVDTAQSSSACKYRLGLSYACEADGVVWSVNNPNDIAVDYTWTLDGVPGQAGMLLAREGRAIAITSPGEAHTLAVTWVDTRPGSRTVSLSASPESCGDVPTATATTSSEKKPSETPIPTSTLTPTVTLSPTATLTPTATATRQPPAVLVTLTFTPTGIRKIEPTYTRTPTRTSTPRVLPTRRYTATNWVVTATATRAAPRMVFTLTPTPPRTATVQPLGFITATQVNTLPAPFITVTRTPALIPITGADLRIGPARARLLGGLLTNLGLFVLGLALAVTGAYRYLTRT